MHAVTPHSTQSPGPLRSVPLRGVVRPSVAILVLLVVVTGAMSPVLAQDSPRKKAPKASRSGKFQPRQEGERERQQLVVDIDYTLKAKRNGIRGGGAREWRVTNARTVTFAKVSKSGRVSAVDIAYGAVTEKATKDAEEKSLPVARQRYRAVLKRGGVRVQTAGGKSVPEDQLVKVTADLRELGTLTPLQRFLLEQRRKRQFEGGVDAAAAFFGFVGDRRLTFKKIEATAGKPRTIDGVRHLVFDTKVRIATLQDGFLIPVNLTGELVFAEATGRVRSWTLAGELLFETAGAVGGVDIEARATGKVSMRREHIPVATETVK